MEKENKKELFKKLDRLKSEANSLNRELNKFNREKESWFRKKQIAFKNIKDKLRNIRENKSKRDELTKKVKELKGKRTKSYKEIQGKIFIFKKLSDEKKTLLSKSKIKDPSILKREIDKMEVKLETEAMPFETEKKISKKLKTMKKSLGEVSELIDTTNKIKKLNPEINTKKKETDKVHFEIQELAKESQQKHESIIKDSKEVDELRKKEDEAFKNFITFKKGFADIDNKLKEKLNEMGPIRDKINKFQLEEDEKRKLNEAMLIKSKEHEFEEKIKTGKKLTTDDFLAFQEVIKDKSA